MNTELIPAILADSQQDFEEKLRLVENDTETIQVDILDGSMFDNTTWFDAKAVSTIKTPVNFELHLMVQNPLPIIESWKTHVPNLKRVIIHAEIERPVGAVIEKVRDVHHLEVGIAINPDTPISEIESVLHNIDELLIMGVHPGASGQAFLGEQILEKIRNARKHLPNLIIGMDGGLTAELIPSLAQAGVQRFCGASVVYKSDDPTHTLKELQKLLSSLETKM